VIRFQAATMAPTHGQAPGSRAAGREWLGVDFAVGISRCASTQGDDVGPGRPSDEVWPEYNQHGETLNYYWAQLAGPGSRRRVTTC
jgi:hypothetical protein